MLWGQLHFGLFWSFSLWWVEECKLGIILADPSEVVHSKMRSFEIRFECKDVSWFWMPFVLIKKEEWTACIRQPVACMDQVVLPFLPSNVTIKDWIPSESVGKFLLHVPITWPLLKYCRTFPRAMSEVWLWFNHDGNTLHVCCKVTQIRFSDSNEQLT